LICHSEERSDEESLARSQVMDCEGQEILRYAQDDNSEALFGDNLLQKLVEFYAF
jgi:hypothetical protein